MATSALLSFTHPPPHLSTSTLLGTSPSPWGGGGTSRTSRFPSSPSFAKSPLFSSSSSLKVSSIEIRRSLHFHMESSALLQDASATAVVMGGAYSLVSSFDLLTTHNFIDQKLSRKLVHVLSGLLFMASWPIFSTSLEARYFAALVPLANCLRLLAYGLSLATDEAMVKSVSREGKPEELLRGPMYYVVMLMLCDVMFWRNSPVGVISLAMMCGGDGFADIIGRRYGTLKLPYNQDKSWAGSICMCFSGFAISIGMLYYFSALGYLQLDWGLVVPKVALVSLAATLVESLPITKVVDDNVSVPLTSVLMTFLLFGYRTL
eukprot:TRINITY_DN6053_c0_g2_i2.p1 TRINITY_DN6053_c0_g2~~TRINITY_DN6053_c0_g2_i2.p1  ORF type:complete len:319 (-),score=49.99 TRINITY_DN6053_c0_g2_i2:332-1288(-)